MHLRLVDDVDDDYHDDVDGEVDMWFCCCIETDDHAWQYHEHGDDAEDDYAFMFLFKSNNILPDPQNKSHGWTSACNQ